MVASVSTSRASAGSSGCDTADHLHRVSSRAVSPVIETACRPGLPPLAQPGRKGFAYPRRARLEVRVALKVRHETRLDDDAVGVVDVELAFELDREVDLAAHPPAHVGRVGANLVERTAPLGHDQ